MVDFYFITGIIIKKGVEDMPVCEKCGKTIQPGARMCIYCGAPVTQPSTPAVYVPKPKTKRPLLAVVGIAAAVVVLLIVFISSTTKSNLQNNRPGAQEISVPDNIKVQFLIPCKDIEVDSRVLLTEEEPSVQLNWSVEPANTTDEVVFHSEDTSIAVVEDNGIVTGVGHGRTMIVLTCGGVEKRIEVICELPSEIPELKLKYEDVTFNHAGYSWIAYLDDVDATLFTWVSDDVSVADVEDGVVIGVGPGVTTIYALYEGEVVASCIIRNKW